MARNFPCAGETEIDGRPFCNELESAWTKASCDVWDEGRRCLVAYSSMLVACETGAGGLLNSMTFFVTSG